MELKIGILRSVPEIGCILFYMGSSISPCEQVRNASNSTKVEIFSRSIIVSICME
jgi:hypothetical protein